MGYMKKNLTGLFILSLISLFPLSGQEVNPETGKTKSDLLTDKFALFADEDLLNVTMRLDLTSFIRKNLNGSSIDAGFTIHLNETDSIFNNIKVKARGKFRYENCSFPPMELSFKKQIHAYSDSDYIKKIKLVTHCVTGEISDSYVLREYLVYKLFNVISDTSFKVRLVKITYIDTQKKKKTVTQYGFLIEPDELLAERLKSTVVKTKNLTQRHIFPEIMDKVSIFNYMIANWDWNVPNLQNVIIIKPMITADYSLGLLLPYDFDLSGLVNVTYGTVPPEYGLNNARDRIFLGICRSKDVFNKDLKFFLSKKEELYKTINDFEYLNQRAKKDITGFLGQFFRQIEDEQNLEYLIDTFMGTCKNL